MASFAGNTGIGRWSRTDVFSRKPGISRTATRLRHQFVRGEYVHVDRGMVVSQRGPRSALGVDPQEIEANQFAACLLMPDDLLQHAVTAVGGSPLVDPPRQRVSVPVRGE